MSSLRQVPCRGTACTMVHDGDENLAEINAHGCCSWGNSAANTLRVQAQCHSVAISAAPGEVAAQTA
jgi:hypothetical protein